MIARCALGVAVVLSVCACSERPQPVLPNSDAERVADDVVAAIEKSDMTPVLSRFVPERKPDLLDPQHVRSVRDTLLAGDFLGVREGSETAHAPNALKRYFIATFSTGREVLTLTYADSGKIVHLRFMPAPA